MMSEKVFRRLCIFNVLYMLVLGGLTVFTVAFLRGVVGFSQSAIVLLGPEKVSGTV